jgi:hypothetical protein
MVTVLFEQRPMVSRRFYRTVPVTNDSEKVTNALVQFFVMNSKHNVAWPRFFFEKFCDRGPVQLFICCYFSPRASSKTKTKSQSSQPVLNIWQLDMQEEKDPLVM